MQAVVLSGNKLEVKEIENTLEELQKIVGGYIEMPLLSKVFRQYEIDTIINEEGKYIEGLNPEIALIDGNTKGILDIVYGSCIFVSHNGEGNTIGLNEKQINIIMEELKLEVNLTFQDTNKEFIVKALFF